MRILRYLPLWLEQQLNRRQCETYSKIRTYRMFCTNRRYSLQAESNSQTLPVDSTESKSPLPHPPNEDQISRRSSASQSSSNSVMIDVDLINHLERTSLVDFGNDEALRRLQEAIKFADTLLEVDTQGVKPMTSVLENETLYLREDKPIPTKRDDILVNASVTEEDYFVAPPGNIPLEPQNKSAY